MRVHSTYSRKARIKKKRNWKRVFWPVFLAFLLAGVAYVLFFTPLFKIKSISAQGTDKISSDEFINAAKEYISGSWWKISKDNYFLVSEAKMTNYLRQKFPGLKSVKANRKFPDGLEVQAKDREKAITYCGALRCFYADEEGIIFEEAPEIYGGMNLTIKDNSGRNVEIGEKALEPEFILFAQKTGEIINSEANIGLVSFQIKSYPTTDLIAQTSEDWQIMFDVEMDAANQVAALKRVLEEKIGDQRGRLEYIDLRIGNRVYYKMKNQSQD